MSYSFCCICFKNKPQKIRICFCLYCTECLQVSENLCGCGGISRFEDISEDMKNDQEINGSLARLFTQKFNETLSSLQRIFLHSFHESENYFEFQDHHDKVKKKRLIDKIKKLEDEKLELIRKIKNNDVKSSSDIRLHCKDDSTVAKRDFSPFEGIWGRFN